MRKGSEGGGGGALVEGKRNTGPSLGLPIPVVYLILLGNIKVAGSLCCTVIVYSVLLSPSIRV